MARTKQTMRRSVGGATKPYVAEVFDVEAHMKQFSTVNLEISKTQTLNVEETQSKIDNKRKLNAEEELDDSCSYPSSPALKKQKVDEDVKSEQQN